MTDDMTNVMPDDMSDEMGKLSDEYHLNEEERSLFREYTEHHLCA